MTIRFFAISSVLLLTVACGSQPAPAPPAQEAAPAAAVPVAPNTALGAPAAAAAASPAGNQAAAANPAVSAAPPAPMMMEMTVPAGTTLEVTLDTPVASDTSKVEDAVRGKLAKAVAVGGMTTIPAGSIVTGTVVEANPSGRVKGRASITIRFNRVVVANTPYAIQTARITREAEATKGEDAKKIGVGAGATVKTTISDPVKINAPM